MITLPVKMAALFEPRSSGSPLREIRSYLASHGGRWPSLAKKRRKRASAKL